MRFAAGLTALLAAGCVQTSELPLAANVYQLEAEGRGLLGAARTDREISKRAAEITLEKGYSHFILANASAQRDTRYAGSTPGFANTTVNVAGSSAFATTTYSSGIPIYSSSKNTSVTVVMFRADDPEAANAIDAAAYLASLEG